MDNIITLMIDEKNIINEELRYYASFMFKYLPIVGSLSLASFGYALQKQGELVFIAIPLLINIFSVGFIYIDYQMTLLDGYAKILESIINKLLDKNLYTKNSMLLSVIFGGNGNKTPQALIINSLVVIIIIVFIYGLSLIKAFIFFKQHQFMIKYCYIVFCILSPLTLVTTYLLMRRKIDTALKIVEQNYMKEFKEKLKML